MNKKKTNRMQKKKCQGIEKASHKIWMNNKYTTFEKFSISLVICKMQIKIGNNMSTFCVEKVKSDTVTNW